MKIIKIIVIGISLCLTGCFQTHKPLEFRMNGHVIKSEKEDPINSFFGDPDMLSMIILSTGAISSLRR